MPDSRPGVLIKPDGMCQGCHNAVVKRQLDWSARAAAFRELVRNTHARARSYDCVIPVSGGKDSFWQVTTCLENGLRPLCVTYAFPRRTALGEHNLRQLQRLGVDHLDLHVAPDVERRFVAKAFRRFAISGLPAHMAIYAWPFQIAVTHDIPLVVYGENTAFEYGTQDESLMGARVDRRWLRTFGVTNGTTVEDWIDEELSARDLAPFALPADEVLESKGVRAIFLGYYFPWDPENSRRIAMQHGFTAREGGARVGHYDFVNIDDDLIGVHHHPKWHKFGITRSWDTLSMEIRSGRLTRQAAIEWLRARGDETPWDDINQFCEYLGWSRAEYFSVLERFRNRELWTRRDDRWVIPDFLIPDFPWPADAAA